MELHKTKIAKALKERDGFVEFAIDGYRGLRLRRYPSGSASWLYRYKSAAGAVRVLKLGDYPDVDPLAAAKRWEAQRSLKTSGTDPHEAKIARAAADRVKVQARADEKAAAKFTVRFLTKIYVDAVSTASRITHEE